MKKVMSSLLVLALVFSAAFALVGCQETKKDIFEIANSSSATQITTSVDYVYEKETISAWYNIFLDDATNNAIVEYEFSRYLSIDEGALTGGDFVEEQSGVIYYYNGSYYTEDDSGVSDPWISAAADADFKFNIVKSLLIDPIIVERGTKLTCTMTPESCESMFGFDFGAEGDLSLEVITNGTNLTDVNISCTTENGAELIMETTYTNHNKDLDFSSIIGKSEE